MSSPASVPHTRILLGLVLGAAVGCLANELVRREVIPAGPVEAAVAYVTKPAGDLFLNLLLMPIIPLVFASLVLGVTRLGGSAGVSRTGAKTLAYFLVTTACAAAIGLTLVNLVRPGDQLPSGKKDELMTRFAPAAGEKVDKPAAFGVDTFVNVVPRNPLKSLVEKDMLAVIGAALLVGFALTRIEPGPAKVMTDLLEGVNRIAEVIIGWAMVLAPYAVFCLIFTVTARFGFDLLRALGAFVLTVLGGLAVHQFVVLPLLVKFLGGMSPVEFFRKARGTMLTAFSTSSSTATLPVAIRCAEDELGVPPEVANFVLPLSASMNHNGTALFEAVTVVFLCQAFGVPLSLGDQLVVLVLCILTATGMAGVPGGSLPLIGLILVQFGVQPGAIALVLGVDRILDMCRTAVNVTADLTTAVFVARRRPGARS